MNIAERNPTPRVEVNYEDDPLAPHPAYLDGIAPLSHWRMNALSGSTEQDTTAGNRDLTYINAPTLAADGAFKDLGDTDPAVSFNGTDEYAETATSSTWQNLISEWSIGAWINPTVVSRTPQNCAGIISTGTPSSGNVMPFGLFFGDASSFNLGGTFGSRVWCGFKNASQNRGVYDSTGDLVANTWYFFVATWDGTDLAIYRNGVLAPTTTIGTGGATPVVAGSTVKLNVGKADSFVNGTGPHYFAGRIDEPFVFDRMLSAIEIANLYRYLSVRAIDEGNYVDLTDFADTDPDTSAELQRLRSFSIRRGRSDPTSRIEAGQGTLLLGNRDGALFPDEPVNRLANPSAEATDEEFLPFVVRGGTQAFAITPVRTGLRAWSLTTDSSSPAYLTTERDGLVGMRPGEEVVFSAYVHVTTSGNVDLADVTPQIVYEVSGVQTVVDGTNPGSFDSYQRVSVTTTIPDDADVAYARIELDAGGASEVIYVDDVQLELGDTATTYCDGDQTDCMWIGEAHKSMSARKRANAPARKTALPMRRVRITATWDGDDYGVFHGYLEKPQFSFPNSGKDSVATYTIVDGTRVLSSVSMRGFSRASELVGPRVRAILAFAGIADDDMDVDDNFIEVGALTAQATIADDRSALSLIRDIEQTERGEFFVSRDGLLTYQGSLARSTEEREAIVFSDSGDTGAVRYRDVAMTIDVATVANDVNIENVLSGTDHSFVYPLSQQRFFKINASEQSYWQQDTATDDPRPAPFPVAESVSVQGFRDPALWPDLLSLELGDLVRLDRTHNGIDVWQGYVHFLEGMSLNATPSGWVNDYLTSPYPVSPFTASAWQTPISKPQLHVSAYDGNPVGASPIVLGSRTYTDDRLYIVLFCGENSTGGPPSLPTFTSAHTWNNIRNDTAGNTRLAAWYAIPTATNTESLSMALTTMVTFRYDVVVLEIVEGFNAGSPIGDTTFGGAGSGGFTGTAVAGAGDVGTLTNLESIVIWHLNKDSAAFANWTGGVEVYDRAGPTSDSLSVAYGSRPGVDNVSFNWGGQANGWNAQGIEIQSA